MKSHRVFAATIGAILALSGTAVVAQDRPQRQDQSRGQTRDDQNRGARNGNDQNQQNRGTFNEHDQQVSRDWYNQHQNHPPAGLRSKDRLSPDEESRLNQGAVLDRNLRKKVHPAPQDLSRQLPPPQNGHRYVVIGGHVASIDNSYQVHDVIHLHDDHSNQRQH
jgi:hypothetical protein